MRAARLGPRQPAKALGLWPVPANGAVPKAAALRAHASQG
jgi:hypothetical protein